MLSASAVAAARPPLLPLHTASFSSSYHWQIYKFGSGTMTEREAVCRDSAGDHVNNAGAGDLGIVSDAAIWAGIRQILVTLPHLA
jgi:hypothetical protein